MSERELFAAHGVNWWHCSALLRRGAIRTPCPGQARRIWIREDGVRVGLCADHRQAYDTEALLRRWTDEADERLEIAA